MKRKLALVLAAVMAVTGLAGCGSSGKADGAKTKDTGKIIILYPGEESDSMSNFINNELNPKLKKEIGEEVQIVYKGWDQYWEQKDIMLAAGNAIDLYWDGLPDIGTMVNKKQCQPLDELIKENCPDMLKAIPKSQLAGGVVNGIQYGIPSTYAPSSCMYQLVCVRQDLLDETGMTDLKTPDDLKEFATKVKEKHPDLSGPADVIFKPLTRYYEDEPLTWCAYQDSVVYGENTKKAYSYYETETFKKVAEFNHSMYKAGLYRDELTTNYNERDSRMQQGTYFWVEGSLGKENEIISAVKANAPDATLKSYLLAPDKDHYITACGGEVLCVPYSAQNPVGAMKLLNWIYKDEANYMYAIYGPEGENYTMEGDKIKLKDPAFGGYFYEWMFRNQNYQKFTTDVSDDYIKTYKAWDKNAKKSDVMAFHFDDTNVKNEETAVSEVLNKTFLPIECGYVDYETAYPAAEAQLKKAGIDKYVAEVQKQLDAYLKTNGYNH